jgi:hypothetical protein
MGCEALCNLAGATAAALRLQQRCRHFCPGWTAQKWADSVPKNPSFEYGCL